MEYRTRNNILQFRNPTTRRFMNVFVRGTQRVRPPFLRLIREGGELPEVLNDRVYNERTNRLIRRRTVQTPQGDMRRNYRDFQILNNRLVSRTAGRVGTTPTAPKPKNKKINSVVVYTRKVNFTGTGTRRQFDSIDQEYIFNTRNPVVIDRPFTWGNVPDDAPDRSLPIADPTTIQKFTNNPEGLRSVLPNDSGYTVVLSVHNTEVEKTKEQLSKINMFQTKFDLSLPMMSKFKDIGEGACVPETLYYKYIDTGKVKVIKQKYKTRKRVREGKTCKWISEEHILSDEEYKEKSIQKIANELQDPFGEDLEPDEPTSPTSGFNTEQISKWCENHGIPLYACDANVKLFYSSYPPKRNKNIPALVFMIWDTHMYLLEDDKFTHRLSVAASNQIKSTVCIQEIEEEKEVPTQEELFDNCEIKQDTDNLLSEICEHYRKTKKLLTPYSCSFQNGLINKIRLEDGSTLVANPDFKKVSECVNRFNELHPEDNIVQTPDMTLMGFTSKLVEHLYPDDKVRKSIFNRVVAQQLRPNAGITQAYSTTPQEGYIGAYDINKCRTSCLRDNVLGEYKVFTTMDCIEPIKWDNAGRMKIQSGFYYILTDNKLPTQGNGWYSDGFLKYLNKEGIKYKPKYQLIASETLPDDYFMKLYEEVIQYPHFKNIANGSIGKLAVEKGVNSKIAMEADFNTACCYFWGEKTIEEETGNFAKRVGAKSKYKIMNRDGKTVKETFIKPLLWKSDFDGLQPERGKDEVLLYAIQSDDIKYYMENQIPVHKQILENEWIKVYELSKVFQMRGGQLIHCQTDNLTAAFGWWMDEGLDWIGFDWNTEISDEIGGYKEGTIKTVNYAVAEEEQFELELTLKQWTEYKEHDYLHLNKPVDSYTLEELADTTGIITDELLSDNRSALIDGMGGFGKSFALRQLVDKLEKRGMSYQVLAPTNKAAINVNGLTIHKFLGIKTGSNKVSRTMLNKTKNIDCLLVDEVSMVNSKLLTLLMLVKRQNPKLKLFLFGDIPHQLPPVGEEHLQFEDCELIKDLSDYNKYIFTINKRSDKTMTDLSIKAFNTGTVNKKDFGDFPIEKAERHLCFRNVKRKEVNKLCMKRIATTKDTLTINTTPEQRRNNSYCQDVIIMVGCPVMSVKNNQDMGYVNNQQWVVAGWGDMTVKGKADEREDKTIPCLFLQMEVDGEGDKIEIPIDSFHNEWVVSYAMTVHKSQSSTFDFKYAIHERYSYTKKMLYTALTRSTNAKDILIV